MVTEFLAVMTGFPTIFFTVLMGLMVLYWTVVSLGMIDHDMLDGALGLDAMDAGLDSALESLDGLGALDGAVDGAIDGAIDGALDGALNAGVDGAIEAADGAMQAAGPDAIEGMGHADGLHGADHGSANALAGLMNALGLRGVPITIGGSFFILWAWLISALTSNWLGAGSSISLWGLGILGGSVAGATLLTGQSVRPFRPLFRTVQAPRRASLVGRMCVLTSGKVTGTSGQAEIEDGGAGFVAEVRCQQENQLRRGDQALVFQYDPAKEIFYVGPIDDDLTRADEIMKGTS